jgi:RNA-directed DNA polymerase
MALKRRHQLYPETGEKMETELTRIAEVARDRPKERFTSLAHLINETSLRECHQEMDGRKASGVDKVTKEEYEQHLEENLRELVKQMKRQAYKPQPARRTYIPKPGTDKMRPLGILVYQDKLVQAAMAKILTAIYEEDFLECSYGFRPGRSCHDALKELNHIIESRKIRYIVDADIKGFFDHVNHEWLMKFIGQRIADPNIHRLIARFLKAGIMEDGVRQDMVEGTPQGGNISPILANVYLHYVLDLWFEKIVKKWCRGEAYLIRYCDDFVCCFEHEEEAKAFYQALRGRLKKFGLKIAEEKTRIIKFGRKAADEHKRDGNGKAETFDFLGFTHYCGKSRRGYFRVKRKTSRKKYKASLLRCKEWIKRNRHESVKELMKALRVKLNGYYRYYGITDNSEAINRFAYEVNKMLYKWLNKRSQRKSFEWSKFEKLIKKYPLPQPRIYVNIYERKLC